MKTTLIAGKKVALYDATILEKLKPDALPGVKNQQMIIGIRNHQGDIYRLLGVTEQRCFMKAIQQLTTLGLVDELESVGYTTDGCDAIFSMP